MIDKRKFTLEDKGRDNGIFLKYGEWYVLEITKSGFLRRSYACEDEDIKTADEDGRIRLVK